MPKKRKNKMYLVLSKKNNYTQGAFPYTDEGKKLAQDFIKTAMEKKKEQFYLAEK